MAYKTICFIGAGNMTRSIVSGLIASGYEADKVIATNPSAPKLEALNQDFGVQTSHNNIEAAKVADVIVLSVKPQLMQSVCSELSDLDLSNKLIITIAAGVKAQRYQDYFQQEIKLIRAMPNTPTQIGVGMTGLFASKGIAAEDKTLAQQLMSTGGQTVWVDKEDELNQVIALAGSSPAYFFLFMESMLEAADKMGMDQTKARELVQQAALGAAEMVKQNPELSPAQLRENVTSKGGTTAEALATFEAGDLRQLVDSAMTNCIKRAEQMAEQF